MRERLLRSLPAAALALLLLPSPTAARPAAPSREGGIRYREDLVETADGEPRGRFSLHLLHPDAGSGAATLAVGRTVFDIPEGSGRTLRRNGGETVSIRRIRRGSSLEVRIRGTSRTWEGSPLAEGMLDYWEGPVFGLERVVLETGAATREFALGLAGTLTPAGRWDGDLWAIRVRGRGPAAGEEARPSLLLCPPGRRGWEGRLAGQVLSTDPGLRPTRVLDEGSPVEAASAETVEMEAGGTVFRQVRFDEAVCAPPGRRTVSLRAGGARVDRAFTAPAAAPARHLDIGSAILEVREDGIPWAWGENYFGEVGDGTSLTPFSPVPLDGPRGVVSVASADDFSLAVDGAGVVWFWGDRESRAYLPEVWWGGIGMGSPVPVPLDLQGTAVQVAAGYEHAAVLMGDGSVRTWGFAPEIVRPNGVHVSKEGFLGRVPGLEGVAAIACGEFHVLALLEDGSVRTWSVPEVGLPGEADIRPVTGLPPVAQVAGGWGWSAAVDLEGNVWTWGSNESGQLGDGTRTGREAPARVAGLPPVRSVSTGDENALAVDMEGGLWAWGGNGSGQVGDGTDVDRLVPVRVPGLGPAVLAATGWETSVAVLEDGSVWIWGLHPAMIGGIGDTGVTPRLYPREFVPGHHGVSLGWAAKPGR